MGNQLGINFQLSITSNTPRSTANQCNRPSPTLLAWTRGMQFYAIELSVLNTNPFGPSFKRPVFALINPDSKEGMLYSGTCLCMTLILAKTSRTWVVVHNCAVWPIVRTDIFWCCNPQETLYWHYIHASWYEFTWEVVGCSATKVPKLYNSMSQMLKTGNASFALQQISL